MINNYVLVHCPYCTATSLLSSFHSSLVPHRSPSTPTIFSLHLFSPQAFSQVVEGLSFVLPSLWPSSLNFPSTVIPIYSPINYKLMWFYWSNFTCGQRKNLFCFYPCCFILFAFFISSWTCSDVWNIRCPYILD